MAASILGHLDRLADEHPDKLLYSYLDVNGDPIESYTYASFLQRVDAIAGYLWKDGRFAAGDRLLQEVAKRIASVMRRSDDLVRWGGEEFLLVCRTTDRQNASLLCTRVLEAVRDLPFDVGNGVQVHKTCSIGWAPYPWVPGDTEMLTIDNVIELADKALYLAKREGRNRSYGLVPAATATCSEKSVSIENLRDCPPELVQIV